MNNTEIRRTQTKKNERRHLALVEPMLCYQMMDLCFLSCGFLYECRSSMDCWQNKALVRVMIALEVHEKCGLREVRPTLLEGEVSED